MVDINDIHLGNWVQVDIEGEHLTGKVERKSVERIGIKVKEELGWFRSENVYPILLTEEWLTKLEFVKEESQNGSLTYRKSRFSLTYPEEGNKQHVLLECHGSHPRELDEVFHVHTLQNHYHEMTKVFLE